MRTAILCLATVLALASSLAAAEKRLWTSRKGTNVEAQLVSVAEGQATLLTDDGREIKLDVTDLSLADRQYLVEYGGADKSLLTQGEVGSPEEEARIDSKTFRKWDEPLQIGDSEDLPFEVLETEHFLVATAGGVRPNGVAETAERLWHGMAFEHMNFRRDWGDQRMLILLVEDEEIYARLGRHYAKYLEDEGHQEAARKLEVMWDQGSARTMGVDHKLIKKHNLLPRMNLFRVVDDGLFRDDLSPFPTHMIAKSLMAEQMGGITSYGDNGYFALLTGFAFYKEIKLGGKSETQLIDASGSEFDEITKTSGFEDGRSWARTLRKLVKRDKVIPDFEEMLSWKQLDLDPEKLVLIYSFAHYCQSNTERLSGFARVVRRIESSNQIPEPIEFARLMGFESAEELEKDWIEFITSTDFK